MPFDAANYDASVTNDAVTSVNPVTDLLETAWGRIDKPQKWCRGAYQTLDGRRYCSIGALDAIEGFGEADHYQARLFLTKAMACSIFVFNDSRTHREVATAWQRAIALSRSP